MLYDYSFWRHLVQPSSLVHILQKEYEDEAKIRGYKKSLWSVFLFTIIYFVVRNLIGIGTEPLTELIATDFTDTYIVARLFSLAGTIIVALLFWFFHYYLLAYVIAALTELPFKWVQKVQLYVILFIVLEKSITLLAFTIAGFNTPFTFFSLAPMTAYVYYHEFLLFFLNQLTVATLVTIVVQYTFFKQWIDQKNNLLLKLILIQLTIALVVAAISILPIIHWIERGLS